MNFRILAITGVTTSADDTTVAGISGLPGVQAVAGVPNVSYVAPYVFKATQTTGLVLFLLSDWRIVETFGLGNRGLS